MGYGHFDKDTQFLTVLLEFIQLEIELADPGYSFDMMYLLAFFKYEVESVKCVRPIGN